nr:MAG TPA: hypothetical protein [Caudoviricetes sp.]
MSNVKSGPVTSRSRPHIDFSFRTNPGRYNQLNTPELYHS